MKSALISTIAVLFVFMLITLIRVNKRKKESISETCKISIEKEDIINAQKIACAKSFKGC